MHQLLCQFYCKHHKILNLIVVQRLKCFHWNDHLILHFILSKSFFVKLGASSGRSFGPLSGWGSIGTSTIRKTHPFLIPEIVIVAIAISCQPSFCLWTLLHIKSTLKTGSTIEIKTGSTTGSCNLLSKQQVQEQYEQRNHPNQCNWNVSV